MLAEREGNPARMNKVEEAILEKLVEQGFDPAASDCALGDLIDRYVDGGWDFRRKPHLGAANHIQGGKVDEPMDGTF